MKKRISLLLKTLTLLDLVKTYISFINTDVISLLSMLNENEELSELCFIKDCLNEIDDNNDFNTSWKTSVNRFNSTLKDGDKEIIISFGLQLGKSDVQGQINNCELHKQQVLCRLNEAEESYKKHGNLCFNLCILSGILIDLVLL